MLQQHTGATAVLEDAEIGGLPCVPLAKSTKLRTNRIVTTPAVRDAILSQPILFGMVCGGERREGAKEREGIPVVCKCVSSKLLHPPNGMSHSQPDPIQYLHTRVHDSWSPIAFA